MSRYKAACLQIRLLILTRQGFINRLSKPLCQDNMVLLLVFLFLALIVSFLCSIMEAALLSAPISFLIAEKEQGKLWEGRLIGL